MEFVGAGLGDGIDHATGAAGDGHVVIRDVDRDLIDGVHRERLLGGRQAVGFETEGIVGADAVDADGVVTRILAADRDFVTRLVGLRDAGIEADVVLQVAVDRGESFDLLTGHVAARTHLVRSEHLADAAARDCNGFEFFDADREIDLGNFIEVQIHVVFGAGAGAFLVHRDHIRAADAQTARVVAAVRIGDDATARARLGVTDDHLRAGHRLTVCANHLTANTGGRALGECGRGRKGDDQSDRQLGKSETFRMVHWSWPQWKLDENSSDTELEQSGRSYMEDRPRANAAILNKRGEI